MPTTFDGWNMFEIEKECPPGTRMNLDAQNILTLDLPNGEHHELVEGDVVEPASPDSIVLVRADGES